MEVIMLPNSMLIRNTIGKSVEILRLTSADALYEKILPVLMGTDFPSCVKVIDIQFRGIIWFLLGKALVSYLTSFLSN